MTAACLSSLAPCPDGFLCADRPPPLLLFAALRSFLFSGDDAAEDERLVDEEEFDEEEDDDRLDADEELDVPDELEPLELDRDVRLRFVFDGDSFGFFMVSVSTVIFECADANGERAEVHTDRIYLV